MRSITGKIAASVAFAIIAASASMMMPSAAHAGDYCANSATGGSSCSFTSMAQCEATASGRDLWCSHVIDWNAWNASHGMAGPADSFAYYPRRGARKPAAPPSDMPVKGEGAQ